MTGQNTANPSGLLQGAIMMLNHIGQTSVAEKVQNAWLTTIEKGLHTKDIFKEGISTLKLGTREFADAVIAHLGQLPSILKAVSYDNNTVISIPIYKRKAPMKKELMGVDVFVQWNGNNPDELADTIRKIETEDIKLTMITNRGIKVWPEGFQETFCTDHLRCRFKPGGNTPMTKMDIIQLLASAENLNIDSIKTENLYAFDGRQAFSMGQGQ